MKSLFLTLVLIYSSIQISAQNSVAKIKYGQAEEAYAKGNYKEALGFVEETEKILKSTNTTTTYLKILCEKNILDANPMGSYELINSLRKNCEFYLTAADGKPDLEDKFKEVYFISEELLKFPKTKKDFDALLIRKEQELAEQERLKKEENERQRKIAEEARIKAAEEEKIRKEKEFRNISYGCFKIGFTRPLNSDMKENITYNQWLYQNNLKPQSPFTTSMQQGEIGLKTGVSIGFGGIKGIDIINSKLNNNRLGFGLNWDINQTFQFYNLNIAGFPLNQNWYIEETTKTPFAITSLGLGPNFSLRVGKEKTLIDCYFRLDANLFWLGRYTAKTYDIDAGSVEAKGYKSSKDKSISPTFGLALRKNKMKLGVEFRLNLNDESSYYDDFSYNNGVINNSYIYYPRYINLSYLSVHYGFVF